MSSSLLAGASDEELFAELRRRGFMVTVDAAGRSVDVAGASMQQHVFNVLGAIEQWTRQERHRMDVGREYTSVWSNVWAFDWARTPKGYCCDANKSVWVGVGEYTKAEDPSGTQILLIRHYDSERPGNYAKRNSCE